MIELSLGLLALVGWWVHSSLSGHRKAILSLELEVENLRKTVSELRDELEYQENVRDD